MNKNIVTVLTLIIVISLGAWWFYGTKETVIMDQVLPAAAATKTFAAIELGVAESEIEIVETTLIEWPDSCLGLAVENELCAQVITAGYEISLIVNGKLYIYRTNIDGTAIRPVLSQ